MQLPARTGSCIFPGARRTVRDALFCLSLGGDENVLPGLHLRRNGLLEVGDHPGDGVLQAFCQRQLLDGHIGVKGLPGRAAVIFPLLPEFAGCKMGTNRLQCSCPRETYTYQGGKTMRFNFCNIWQLLCQLGGFGC